ncbi:MAG: AAA family ATPase, partial [Parachlamydiales bacterium]
MLLLTLRLHNFRNFSEEFVRFHPHFNLICGENAQGKTNLLEAISLISTGRSFRTSRYQDLIRHGEKFFFLEAGIIKDLVSQTIKIYYDGKEKKIHLSGKALPNFTSLLGLMPSTIYSPQDVELISGFPLIRRRFLNLLLAQSDPLYVHHLSRFLAALKERSYLLKKGSQQNRHRPAL